MFCLDLDFRVLLRGFRVLCPKALRPHITGFLISLFLNHVVSNVGILNSYFTTIHCKFAIFIGCIIFYIFLNLF